MASEVERGQTLETGILDSWGAREAHCPHVTRNQQTCFRPLGRYADGRQCARLRANLENIVSGSAQTVCWEPYKGRRYHQIGRLSPPQDFMFDIRCVEDPSLRITFHFAERDVIVAHLCSPRSLPVPWLQRLPLGDRGSREWQNIIMESNAIWGHLFPGTRPHSGNHIDELLSNANLC